MLFDKFDKLLYDKEVDIENYDIFKNLEIKEELLDNLEMESIKKLFKVCYYVYFI